VFDIFKRKQGIYHREGQDELVSPSSFHCLFALGFSSQNTSCKSCAKQVLSSQVELKILKKM